MKVKGVGTGCLTCDPSGAVPLLTKMKKNGKYLITKVKKNDEYLITFTPTYHDQRSGH